MTHASLAHYNGSLIRALQDVFPEIGLDESKFSFLPSIIESLTTPNGTLTYHIQRVIGSAWRTAELSLTTLLPVMGLTL